MKKITLFVLICFGMLLPRVSQAQKKGDFGMHTELGYAFGLSKTGENNISYNYHGYNLMVSPGFYITDNLFAGIGAGVYNYSYTRDIYKEKSVNFLAFPVYIHGLYTINTNSVVTPFLNIKAGYGFISKDMNLTMLDNSQQWTEEYSGGLYLSPSIGVFYPLNTRHALSLSVSYDMQKYKRTFPGNATTNPSNETNSAISLKVGWFF